MTAPLPSSADRRKAEIIEMARKMVVEDRESLRDALAFAFDCGNSDWCADNRVDPGKVLRDIFDPRPLRDAPAPREEERV